MEPLTCKWGAAMGGGTLGSKGRRPKGGLAAGGEAGVLRSGCLRCRLAVAVGAAAVNRDADCCAILLLQRGIRKTQASYRNGSCRSETLRRRTPLSVPRVYMYDVACVKPG